MSKTGLITHSIFKGIRLHLAYLNDLRYTIYMITISSVRNGQSQLDSQEAPFPLDT